MKTDLVLATPDDWRVLTADGRTRPVTPYADRDRPTRVVAAFPEEHTGVLRFEGSTQYASAIIERQVRQEGWLEGVGHIVIHSLRRSRGGGVAFYTAVALDEWQRMQDWASRQKDHCLLYPAGTLLAGVAEGSMRVLRINRRLRVVLRSSEGLHTADAFSASLEPEDLRIAVNTLASDVARWLDAESGPSVEWITAGAATRELDDALANAFGEQIGAQVSVLPVECFEEGDAQWWSALPAAMARIGPLMAVNPGREKLAWIPEAFAPQLAAAVAVIAVALGAVGEVMKRSAAQENAQAEAVIANTLETRSRYNAVELDEAHERLEKAHAFLERFHESVPFSPGRSLSDIRRAAGDHLLIQRVELEPHDDDYRLLVDGRLPDSASQTAQMRAMRHFLASLHEDGWRTEAIDPSHPGAGSFSFRLRPLEP